MAGVRINDIPKFLVEDTDKKTHAIIVDDQLNTNESLITPLVLKGVTSYFLYMNPRASEYEYDTIPHTEMTSEELVWEPYDTTFKEQE